MTPTPAPSAPTKLTVKRNVFDLSKFDRVSMEKEIELKTVQGDLSSILTEVDGDESKAVEIFNIGYRRQQIADAKMEMGGENFVSPKVVSGFVVQLRPVVAAQNRELFAKDDKVSTKAQTTKVYDYIRGVPALVDAIKAIALAQASVVDDEDETDEPAE